MQRAAAASSPGSEILSPDVPPAKRQKLSSIPESTLTPSSDHQAIQAALKAEEEKILHAVDRRAAEAGETKWSLSYSDQGEAIKESGGLQVVSVGYSFIDASGSKNRGRMKFGNFISSPAVSLPNVKLFGNYESMQSSRLQAIYRNKAMDYQTQISHLLMKLPRRRAKNIMKVVVI